MTSISSAEPATKINLLSVASGAESRDLAVRGILIIAIVFGHDRMLFQSVPFYFAALYFWHVQAFFFLAYRRRSDLAEVRIVDRFARYLMPFFVFAGGLALARLVFQPATTDHLLTFVLALVIGSAPLLKEATGMSLFWFLPALAGFSATPILANVNISVFVFSKPAPLLLDLLNAAATVAAGLVVFRVAGSLIRRPLIFPKHLAALRPCFILPPGRRAPAFTFKRDEA